MLKKFHEAALDEIYVPGSNEEVFSGRLLKVQRDHVTLPNGNDTTREYIRHPGAVAIVPVLADGSVVLVKQCRYPLATLLWEIPAGKLDEPGEPKVECAFRELEEETGYRVESPENLEYLMSLTTTVAFCDEAIDIFVAHNLIPSHQNLDEDEVINVVPCSLEELEDMVYTGKITDGKTIAAIMAYARKYRSEDKKDSMVRG